MAKRKREPANPSPSGIAITSKTKKGGAAASPHKRRGSDSWPEYKIRSILKETKDKYLIDWADDEETGEAYQPTWEVKRYANALARDEWNARKANEASASPSEIRDPPKRKADSPGAGPAPKRTRGRPRRRVIESSPSVASPRTTRQTALDPAHVRGGASQEVDFDREIAESPQPDDSTHLEAENSPAVLVSEPPSSYLAGRYQRFDSSIQDSAPEALPIDNSYGEDPEPGPSKQPSTLLEQEEHRSSQAEPDSSLSRVIPDSQSQQLLESTFRGFSPEASSQADFTQASQPLETQVQHTSQHSERNKNPQSQHLLSPPRPEDREEDTERISPGVKNTAGGNPPLFPSWTPAQEVPSNQQISPLPSGSTVESGEPANLQSDSEDRPCANTGGQDKDGLEQTTLATPRLQSPKQQAKLTSSAQTALSTQPAQNKDIYSTQHDAVAYPSLTQPSASANNYVIISSENPETSADTFETPPDYQPPPGGQRPPPSSYLESIPADPRFDLPCSATSFDNAATQSSFPFATQLIRSTGEVEKVESRVEPTISPRQSFQRALLTPDLPPAPARGRSAQKAISQESSPIPSIPSRTLGTIGESAPACFESSSNSPATSPGRASMETTTSRSGESLSLKARLHAMREGRRSARNIPSEEQPASSLPPAISAEVAAARLGSPIPNLQEGFRSPSAVPAMEPTPHVTKEEMNTSERYDTLLPQAQSSNSALQSLSLSRAINSTSSALQIQSEDDPELINAHVVPVPLMARQRDQYKENLFWHRHQQIIERFLGEVQPSEELLLQVENLIDRLRRISMHPDLIDPEMLSQVSTPERQAQWDGDCSAKFRFLKELFIQLRESGLAMHVAVAAHGNKAPDMLETFLEGIHMPFKRNFYAEAQQDHSNRSGLRVSVVDLDKDIQEIDNVDLVIAMDGTTDLQHQLIRAFRRHARAAEMMPVNEWAMLLTLVAPGTIEHIERCMAPNLPRLIRDRILLRAALRIGEAAGRQEPGQYSRQETAALIAEYLGDPEVSQGAEWPLVGLGMIKDLDSQTDTDNVTSSNGETSTQEETGTAKRPFGVLGPASPTDTSKRPRLTPVGEDAPSLPATMNPHDLEITHISDSLGKPTQPALHMMGATTTELDLSEALRTAQDRLDDHVKALEDLQYRFEDQHKELIDLKKARDQTIESAQRYLERMTLVETQNTALRTERSELKQQLEDATRKLLDHSVPEQAELEQLRLASRQALLDKEKAVKRAETAATEQEVAKDAYRESSNQARDLAAENTDLQSRLTIALDHASGERVRAQEASNDLRAKALEKENKRLKLMLRDRDAGTRFRDEEIARLKETGRGRMGTRGSSVPRSPRMGSPMKAANAPRSRGASPAAGEPMRRAGSHLNPSRGG